MDKLKLKHGKNYFSPSQLKKLYISIGQLQAYLTKQFTGTDAMKLGSAVHCVLLEPFDFDNRYIVLDDSKIVAEIGGARPTATKKYREWFNEFEAENKGKIFLTRKEKDIIDKIKQKCDISGITDTYFDSGEAENKITGTVIDFDQQFDALCIVDYDTEFMSVDLKTTSKPLHKFRYDANELGYDIQARLTNAINGKEFVFVVVQTVEPYDIGVFTCSESFMDRGKMKINKALDNYTEYEDNFSTQILSFEL